MQLKFVDATPLRRSQPLLTGAHFDTGSVEGCYARVGGPRAPKSLMRKYGWAGGGQVRTRPPMPLQAAPLAPLPRFTPSARPTGNGGRAPNESAPT